MKTIELQLDEQTFERMQQLAELRQYTVEAFITEMVEQLAVMAPQADPLLGMFAEEPELIDQVLASVMKARETHPLRLVNG